MKSEIIVGVVVGAVLAGGGLFFTFESRVSQLEAKLEGIPTSGELEQFREKDLANALNDFPAGTVIGISEKEVEVPSGWSICDGTNGTPDLTGKFLVGVSSKSEVGNTGGAAEIESAGSHSHSGTTNPTKGPDHGIHCSGNCGGGRTAEHSHSFTTGSSGEHSHGDNRPPFFSTLFICKI